MNKNLESGDINLIGWPNLRQVLQLKKEPDSTRAESAIEKNKSIEHPNSPVGIPITESASNAIHSRQIERNSLKTFRLTRDPSNSFSLDLGDGRSVVDLRRISVERTSANSESLAISHNSLDNATISTKMETVAGDKSSEVDSMRIVQDYLSKLTAAPAKEFYENSDNETFSLNWKVSNRHDEGLEKDLKHKGETKELRCHNMGASAECLSSVQKGLASIPAHIRAELESSGVEVYVFKSIADYDKAFGTHKAQDGGNGAESVFDSSVHPPRIAVFENYLDGTPIKNSARCSPEGLVRHELGHAISSLKGYRHPDFETTLSEEALKLPEKDKKFLMREIGTREHPGPLYRYFGTESKDETYAEMFAMVTGGASDPFYRDNIEPLFSKNH